MQEGETTTRNLEEEVKDLTGHVEDFVETWAKLNGVKLAQKTASLVASIINFTILAVLFFLFILFVGLGLAWWVGLLVNNRAGGFFIVGGVYLLCMFLVMALGRKTTIPYLRNLITRLIYD